MDSLKHNQPQLSVVLFNQKNMLDFSIQRLFFPASSYDESWGQKPSNAMP